jgi:hypothetical protein
MGIVCSDICSSQPLQLFATSKHAVLLPWKSAGECLKRVQARFGCANLPATRLFPDCLEICPAQRGSSESKVWFWSGGGDHPRGSSPSPGREDLFLPWKLPWDCSDIRQLRLEGIPEGRSTLRCMFERGSGNPSVATIGSLLERPNSEDSVEARKGAAKFSMRR